ncbi:hypothetical protein ACS0TY_017719 [Phlomoides rotata]
MAGDSAQAAGEDREEAFELLWQSKAVRHHQAIAWKVLKLRLPTKDELRKRRIIPDLQDISCPLCGVEDESVYHLFFGCIFSRQIWDAIYRWMNIVMVPHIDPKSHLLQHTALLGSKKF